jgi:hypothetical protein
VGKGDISCVRSEQELVAVVCSDCTDASLKCSAGTSLPTPQKEKNLDEDRWIAKKIGSYLHLYLADAALDLGRRQSPQLIKRSDFSCSNHTSCV